MHCVGARDIRITDCEITDSGGNGIWLENASGTITGNILSKSASTAIVSFDAQGLLITHNTIFGTNENGIEILRRTIGDDGTQVLDNRIEDIKAGPGGSGQYGNAINVFRAGNVIYEEPDSQLRLFRGARQFGFQYPDHRNSVGDVREVALYSEFAFEGALIADNVVDGAAVGISVCNFNEGGRLAACRATSSATCSPSARLPRAGRRCRHWHHIEADTAVSGNVIENAPSFGIIAGWGKYLRDVAITGNVIRKAYVGIGLSVAPGAGTALVNNNMISESARGPWSGSTTLALSRATCPPRAHSVLVIW